MGKKQKQSQEEVVEVAEDVVEAPVDQHETQPPDTWVADNFAWLQAYIRQMQEAMGASHWDLVLEVGWPHGQVPESSRACVMRSSDYHTANISVRRPHSDAQLRRTIAHEILHLLTREIDSMFDTLEEHFGTQAWAVAHSAFWHSMEQSIDAIATAWSETLPMPPAPEERSS